MLSFSASVPSTTMIKSLNNPVAVAVAAEEVVEVTDPRPLLLVVAVPQVETVKVENLSSTTTTSQPYEYGRVKFDIKKVTVKCLRHCKSDYANDQRCFKESLFNSVDVCQV